MSKLKYATGIKQCLSKKSIDIIEKAATDSLNDEVIANSTIRPANVQARAMCDNLINGIIIKNGVCDKVESISYKAPGQAVVDIFIAWAKGKTLIDIKNNRSTIEMAMVAKIIELSLKGQRVSLHCVDEETYSKMNIVDIKKELKNPRDFVKELIKSPDVIKVITPYVDVNYNSTKVIKDIKEPAIHIEIKQ